MEYINDLIRKLTDFIKSYNLYSDDLSQLEMVEMIFLGFSSLMILLFIMELYFYLRKRPRGMSTIILIIGILGTFLALYATLINSHGNKLLSAYLLDSASIGILGGVLAVVLSIIEVLYYSNINEQRSIERSVKDLIRLSKADYDGKLEKIHQQALSKTTTPLISASPDAISKKEIQHLSQQLYDLTHHLKQELDESRKKSDENTQELIEKLTKAMQRNGTHAVTESPVMGPKIVAKTSLNSQTPSSNDSLF